MKAAFRLASAALALGAAVALSACSGSTSSPAPASVAQPGQGAVGDQGQASQAGGGATEDDAGAADRSVVTTGTATILVADPVQAADAAAGIADQAGGRVDAREEQAPTDYDGGSASVTLRIPAAGLTNAIESLKALGTPQTVALGSDDVTMRVNDLDAQINALSAAIDRLTALMADATSTDDLIEIEGAVTDRQSRLDSLRAQQRDLQDQVAMATITVSFVTEPVRTTPPPVTFWDGLVAGWNGLAAFASGLLVVVGALLPWLIPLAIAGGIVWLIIRLARRRAASRTQPTSTTPAP